MFYFEDKKTGTEEEFMTLSKVTELASALDWILSNSNPARGLAAWYTVCASEGPMLVQCSAVGLLEIPNTF